MALQCLFSSPVATSIFIEMDAVTIKLASKKGSSSSLSFPMHGMDYVSVSVMLLDGGCHFQDICASDFTVQN